MTNGDKHLVLTYYSISGCCIGSRIIANQLHICNLDTPTKYLKIFVSNIIRYIMLECANMLETKLKKHQIS